jgi:hypothetical protein
MYSVIVHAKKASYQKNNLVGSELLPGKLTDLRDFGVKIKSKKFYSDIRKEIENRLPGSKVMDKNPPKMRDESSTGCGKSLCTSLNFYFLYMNKQNETRCEGI